VPEKVNREAVVAGRRAYADEAAAFDGLIEEGKLLRKRIARSPTADRLLLGSAALGSGERGALRLFCQERADCLVTDDRAFLNLLIRHRIPFLTPREILIRRCTESRLGKAEARRAADRLRPLIRQEVYEDLEARLEEPR
jgi:hypothetical protein